MGILIVGLTLDLPAPPVPIYGVVALLFRRIVNLVGDGRALAEKNSGQSIRQKKPEPRLISDIRLKVSPASIELVAAVLAVMADRTGLDRGFGIAVNRHAVCKSSLCETINIPKLRINRRWQD